MELTRKQEKGLKIAVDRYHNGEAYTVISGTQFDKTLGQIK